MNNNLRLLHIDVKLLAIFECATCHAKKLGLTERLSIQEESLEAVTEKLKNYQPRNFPVGWSSYGVGNYKCEKCKT